MKRISVQLPIGFLLSVVLAAMVFLPAVRAAEKTAVSGEIRDGYRVLRVLPSDNGIRFRVYRGDYIKFAVGSEFVEPLLRIPNMGLEERLDPDLTRSPYVKMKQAGDLKFSIGSVNGIISVIDYLQSNYRELSVQEAAAMIDRDNPVILDVRTRREYAQAHLAGSILIPVQELQARIGELSGNKDREILVYCATGNRSTVASKILIDSGFNQIYNMRRGIAGWGQKKMPVVR